jgi:anti-anti-sigma factor
LPLALEVLETHCILRLEGDIDIACSGELKTMITEAILSRKRVLLDLAGATDLDVTAMQLFWAAAREAERAGTPLTVAGALPENIALMVREAGFETFPVPTVSAGPQANSTLAESDRDTESDND